MIAVLVYRPEAAEEDEGKLGGVELLGLFDNVREDSVYELVNSLAEMHPEWLFHIDPGHEVIEPEDVLRIYGN